MEYYRWSLFDLPHHDPEGLEASKYPISTMTLFHGVNVLNSLLGERPKATDVSPCYGVYLISPNLNVNKKNLALHNSMFITEMPRILFLDDNTFKPRLGQF